MSQGRQNPVDHPVPDPVRDRWSPVSFEPEPVEPERLAAVFEAARWAASSYNEQPWRFVIARREDEEHFAKMLDCLVEANREWARHASVLSIVCAASRSKKNGKPNPYAWFDAGQAVAQLMLAAVDHGLYCHAMGGYSADKAREIWEIDEDVDPVCALAIGRLGDGELLDDETAERDRSPRERRPLAETVFEGRYGEAAGFTRD